MKKILNLSARIKKAHAAMEKELVRAFPVGTRVRCYIMHGQINPSMGDVICHPGGDNALIRLRLDSRTNDVRDVCAWDTF